MLAGAFMKLNPFTLASLLLLIQTAVLADFRDDVGYRSLEDDGRLRSKGANVTVGQVEAAIGGAYLPDFTAPEFAGKVFNPSSGAASGHATMVGRMFYGSGGIAPGVRNVNVWETNHFLTWGLRVGQRKAPRALGASVINNSWIAAFPSDTHNLDAIRRLDWMIERDDVVVVAAVDNEPGSAYPKLLGTAYNAIAVGTKRGSSGGPITFDSRGPRAKPDLVVDVFTTSEAAGVVSGAAALLRSEAKARQMNISELTTKALLMAGAERPDDWERGDSTSSDDERVPLDYAYGAGTLNVENSFDILTTGKRPNGGTQLGWDTALSKKKGKTYPFTITHEAGEEDHNDFTAVLTWNRDIKRGARGSLKGVLADLDLTLQEKHGRRWRTVAHSDSSYDNVETITLDDLDAGNYKLLVRGAKPETYSLAWFKGEVDDRGDNEFDNSGPGSMNSGSSTLAIGPMEPTVVPEPTVFGLLIPAVILLARRRR